MSQITKEMEEKWAEMFPGLPSLEASLEDETTVFHEGDGTDDDPPILLHEHALHMAAVLAAPHQDAIDPVRAARLWVAENPQAPGAVHVLSALASVERYRLLAEVAEGDGNAGCRIVLGTLGNHFTITSTRQTTDAKIASLMADYFRLIQSVANDLNEKAGRKEERPDPPAEDGLRVVSVGDHGLDAFRPYVNRPAVLLVGDHERVAAVGRLLGRHVMVSDEEWVTPEVPISSGPE